MLFLGFGLMMGGGSGIPGGPSTLIIAGNLVTINGQLVRMQ